MGKATLSSASSASIAEILKGTNEVEDNTNTLPETTSKAMAIYDKDGKLIGYIPVYSSSW